MKIFPMFAHLMPALSLLPKSVNSHIGHRQKNLNFFLFVPINTQDYNMKGVRKPPSVTAYDIYGRSQFDSQDFVIYGLIG